MRGNFNLLLNDKLIKYSFWFSVVLIIVQTLLVAIFAGRFPPLIPFLNSQPWGNDRLYPASSAIIILPIMLVAVFVLNNILSAYFYKANTLIARILAFNSLLFIILAMLAFIQIVFLVF